MNPCIGIIDLRTSGTSRTSEVCQGAIADEPVPACCALSAIVTWTPLAAHSALVPLSLASWPH